MNLGARRITVSTSGLVPQIRALAEEGLPLGLAVSLHATTDELRDQLVPVNQRWPIAELLAAAREYGQRTGRRVTLEYTLIGGRERPRPRTPTGWPRSRASCRARSTSSPTTRCPGLPWKRPTPRRSKRSPSGSTRNAPAVTVRHTLGGEIWAACGQLGGLSPGGLTRPRRPRP